MNLFAALPQNHQWIIVAVGIVFVFFGAAIYYSAIRLFGSIIGGLVALIVVYNLMSNSTLEQPVRIAIYIAGVILGALIGSTLAIVFQYIVFFACGAVIFLILYKMFAMRLVTPEVFYKLTMDAFMGILHPSSSIEYIVMIVGGVIYMASAHLLIVVTMSLVGAFLVAFSFNSYILFPVLAAVGSAFQYAISRTNRTRFIRRRFVPED